MTRSRITGKVRIGVTVIGLVLGERGHPGHAHQPRPAVDLRAARPALAGLAVPADGEVAGLGGLEPVDDVEDDLALVHLHGVVAAGRRRRRRRARPGTSRRRSCVLRRRQLWRSGTSSQSLGEFGRHPAAVGTRLPSTAPSPSRRDRSGWLPQSSVRRREVVAGVPAAALLAPSAARATHSQTSSMLRQVDRQVPARVVLAVPLDATLRARPCSSAISLQRLLHLALGADDADQVVASSPAGRAAPCTGSRRPRVERRQRRAGRRVDRPRVDRRARCRPGRRRSSAAPTRPAGRRPAGRQRVAAEPVGAVHAAGHLAGGVQPGHPAAARCRGRPRRRPSRSGRSGRSPSAPR